MKKSVLKKAAGTAAAVRTAEKVVSHATSQATSPIAKAVKASIKAGTTSNGLAGEVTKVREKEGNVWKCVAFLMIGIIGGALLSPAKGGILIGSYNGAHGTLSEPIPPMPPEAAHNGHKHRPGFFMARRRHPHFSRPLTGGIVIGSFNGAKLEREKHREPEQR